MATEQRHAAWQTKGSFTVQLLAEQAPPTDLVSGLHELLDAVDFAVEWLNREDPAREGSARLAIIETRAGLAEEVWTYPPSKQRTASQELVRIFGFNPAAWRPQGAETAAPSHRRHAATAAPTKTAGSARADSSAGDEPAPHAAPPATAVAAELRADEAVDAVRSSRSTIRSSAIAAVRAAWERPASRSCLILAVLSLWLSLTLSDPAFLALLTASATTLWVLHHRRQTPITDPDDWL